MSGAQCCENPPNLTPTCGAGHVEEFGGLKSYLSGHSDSKLAVILISDVFGFEAPNLRMSFLIEEVSCFFNETRQPASLIQEAFDATKQYGDYNFGSYVKGMGTERKLADKIAAAGFFVVVPDFFHGDPYSPEGLGPIMDWLKNHGPDQGFEDAKPVIEALKSKGVIKIGAAGFCWGAKVVVELAKYAYINAAVLLHPSLVTLDDIRGVKVPISVLGAETDHMSPPELVKQFEEALNSKPEVDAFVKIFPGVSHGWSVRYKDEDEVAVKCAEEAHCDLLDWFGKYLKQ